MGGGTADYYPFALEALLEKQNPEERTSLIWLYADSDEVNLVDIEEKLASVDWKKKFDFKEEIKIERELQEKIILVNRIWFTCPFFTGIFN